LILASQVIVISHSLGVGAAATWAIATRPFYYLGQILWRLFDFSLPGLSEMMVRHETSTLRRRFEQIAKLVACLAAVSAVGLAFLSRDFVVFWTAGRILWKHGYDVMLGLWLFLLAVFHVHTMFVMVSKEIRFMRFVYFIEGITCVAMSLLLVKLAGLAGLIATFILVSMMGDGQYGMRRTALYFQIPFSLPALRWQAPALLVLAVTALMAALARITVQALKLPSFHQWIIQAIAVSVVGLFLVARLNPLDEIGRFQQKFQRWRHNGSEVAS
jgi:O-antigen/teichoic acid export membrane protein